MKDIASKLINLFKQGYCTPQIAKKIKEPSTTIHYNIKKLEREGKIVTYGAIFDYKKIGYGYCVYVFANLKPEKYDNPEEITAKIAKDPYVESIDICSGEHELVLKLRTRDVDEYYEWVKKSIKLYGFSKIISLTSLKQINFFLFFSMNSFC